MPYMVINNESNLAPKVLLILGASSDLGIEYIKKYGENYDIIFAHFNHMNEELAKIKDKLEDKIIFLQADFSDSKSISDMIKNIRKTGIVPSYIIHFSSPKFNYVKLHKNNFNVFKNEFQISFFSFLNIIQEFIPDMMKNKYGRIVVLLTSCTNNMPPKFLSHYVSSKYALLGLIKSISVDYGDKGIIINGISPEMIETKFLENIPNYIIENHADNQPMKNNISSDDVIETINFLLSDKIISINGQNICITGGR